MAVLQRLAFQILPNLRPVVAQRFNPDVTVHRTPAAQTLQKIHFLTATLPKASLVQDTAALMEFAFVADAFITELANGPLNLENVWISPTRL